MSYIGVPGRSYCQVQVGEFILPLHSMAFGSLLVTEHMLYKYPMGQLTFVDSLSLIPKVIMLKDGLPVRIVLGITPEKARTYHFRVFNVQQHDIANGRNYSISLISDLDVWRLQPYRKSITATSSDALGQLASECGFVSTSLDATNDKQTWLAGNKTPADFAYYMAQRGYVDATSCLLLGVTLGKQLRYINLNGIDFQRALPHFTKGSEEGMVVTSFDLVTRAGQYNAAGGYNTTSVQFKPGTGEYEQHSAVETRRVGGAVDLNAKVKSSAGTGRFKVLPIDAGNNHAKATQAQHQNARIRQLLSHAAIMVTPMQTSVSLFDPILCSIYTMDKFSTAIKPDPAVSGPWVVAGKTCYLSGSLVYVEKIHVIRTGYAIDSGRQA